MNDPTSEQSDHGNSGTEQPLVEAKLVLGENPAHNEHPSVLINGDDPGRSVMVDPMVYQIVVARPLHGPVTVDLSSPYERSEIRYTLNGNNPTNTSSFYSMPLTFHQNATGGHTAIKARIYDKRNSNLKGKIIKIAFRVITSK